MTGSLTGEPVRLILNNRITRRKYLKPNTVILRKPIDKAPTQPPPPLTIQPNSINNEKDQKDNVFYKNHLGKKISIRFCEEDQDFGYTLEGVLKWFSSYTIGIIEKESNQEIAIFKHSIRYIRPIEEERRKEE